MESKEKLDPKEEAKKLIDHFLNDFGEYPDLWLTDEEKKAKPESGSELAEKQYKGLHNKYSATWLTNILLYSEINFIPLLPEEKRAEYALKYKELFAQSKREQKSALSEEIVQKANTFLIDIKQLI